MMDWPTLKYWFGYSDGGYVKSVARYDNWTPPRTLPITPPPMPPTKGLTSDTDVLLAYLQRIEAKIDAIASDQKG